ncbi:MAG: hypothetical protein H6732_17790 [Alphaproteobacteria bacterium]|nr:hypothetical protein [Alphaproteobacteria bacterium]
MVLAAVCAVHGHLNHGGIPMRSGNIRAANALCSTDLLINPRDQNGTGTCGPGIYQEAWGFAWTAFAGFGCLQNPGLIRTIGLWASSGAGEQPPLGFAGPLELDRGTTGNTLEVYVRR